MNYKQSKQILKEIKKAKKILVNCHRSPDPDSIGSAIAMYRVLIKMGKSVEIICPTKEIEGYVKYLKDFDKIKTVDFTSLEFESYDLLIALDSASWGMVTNKRDIPLPKIPIVVIDHHNTNDSYGKINLVDKETISCCEILYWVFKDWGVSIDKKTANALMAGLIGDTGAFQFPKVTSRTLRTAEELMKLGADKDKAIHNIFRSADFKMVKFLGEVLSRMGIDRKHKFVWSVTPYDVYKKYGKPVGAKEMAAGSFTQIVKDTEFGFVAIEQERGTLSVSFRSRTGFDTTKISSELGGGGLVYASGAKIELPFDEAVEKVLKTARKFAMKNASKKKQPHSW